MQIKWECDDGYAGGAAPQSFKLSDEEILDCDDADAAMQLIEDEIQRDFEQKVCWTADLEKIRAEVQEMFAAKKEDEAA